MEKSKKLILFILIFMGWSEWSLAADSIKKPVVVTSFAILQSLTMEIAQQDFEVINLIPQDMDPHQYEIKPKDLNLLQKSDLIILNGAGFEGWVSLFFRAPWKNLNRVEIIDQIQKNNKDVSLIKSGHNIDPHAWMDPSLAVAYADIITTELKKLRPDLKSQLDQRLDLWKKNVLANLEIWKKKMQPMQGLKILTTHEGFEYMARCFDLKMISILGWNSGEEIKPQKLKSVIDPMKKEKFQGIFYESPSQKKLVDEISRQTSVPVGGILLAENLNSGSIKNKNYVDMLNRNVELILQTWQSRSIH